MYNLIFEEMPPEMLGAIVMLVVGGGVFVVAVLIALAVFAPKESAGGCVTGIVGGSVGAIVFIILSSLFSCAMLVGLLYFASRLLPHK